MDNVSSEKTFGQAIQDELKYDEQSRLKRYKDAWQAYYGHFKKPLKVRAGQPDDNVLVNFTALPVNVKNAFLFGEPGKEIEFVTDENDGDANESETYLKGVWKQNKKMSKLEKIALNGAVCGNTYVRVMPARPFERYPRIIPIDPAIVTPYWAHDDIDDIWRWVLEYEAQDPKTGQVRSHRQTIERDGRVWAIVDEEKAPDATRWNQVGQVVTWNYTWAPIHHCQNYVDPNVFWGLADIEDDVIQLNESVNFILSNIARILRFNAHPKTWGRGFNVEQLKVAIDETLVIENPDGMLQNLEMTSDLGSSISFYEAIRSSLRQITHVPEVALGGVDDVSRVSSLALKVLYGPLLIQIGRKRKTYGEMLEELNSHLLELGGLGADIPVMNKWPYVLPEDPMQEAQTLLIDQQLGASKDTTLRKRGYNPVQESLNKEQEGGVSLGSQLLAAFDRGDENA